MTAPKPTWPRRLLDAAQYAVALTLVVAALSGVFGVVVGGGAVAVKYGLFLGGTAHLGYATILAWWGSRADALSNTGFLARLGGSLGSGDGDASSSGNPSGTSNAQRSGSAPGDGLGSPLSEPSGFQRAVRRLPPVAWYPVRARDRVGDAGRLFLASGLMFLASFLLEAVFGVALVSTTPP
jgi:hypothetical protein